MLRNGALSGRDSCAFSPKSDDSTKKCVKFSLPDETAEVPSFKSESYGVPITFSSPRSREALLDLMVATIRARDLRTCSTLVICQQNAEARHVKSEMGKRNISTVLLDANHLATHNLVRLWSQGYIQQVLIACDDHLNLLEGICVDFVIHTALPPVEKFKDRLKMLSKSQSKAEMLAFISDGPNEEIRGLQSQPEIGNAFGKKKNAKTPQLVVKPLKDNLEEASDKGWTPRALIRENESVKDVPSSLEESLPEEPEFEGWETPPVMQRYMLPVEKFKDRLNMLSKSESKAEMLALNSDDPKEKIRGLQSQPEMGNDFEKESNSKTPQLNDNLKRVSDEAWSPRPLEEFLSEEPEFEGWETNSTTPQLNDSLKRVSDEAWSPRPLEEFLSEEPEFEGWETPPEIGASRASSKDSVVATRGPSSSGTSVIASEVEGMTRAQFGVLVWSRDPIVPCYDLSGVPDLNPSIRDTMMALMEEMKDRQARGLQRYAWPHVSSGKSLVVVGPEKVGKTWCFLPSLCQRTHEHMLLRSERSYGPTSIVVCFNQLQGNQILHWIIKLLDPLSPKDRVPYKKIVTLWEKGNVKEAADSLRHSVGILLTTPDMLTLLKEKHTKRKLIFDAKSIKCLALDNLSDMMRHLPDTTARMIDWLLKFDFGADRCQLFVTTRLWPEILMRERLLHLVPDVLIVFKDPLEATIYWKSSIEVNLTKPEEKSRSLVQMLQDRSLNDQRIVVMCHTKEEVLNLKHKLVKAGIRAEAIYSDGGLSTVNQWRLRTLPVVLLVTDDMVNKVKCGPIDQVIHYTPAISWMRFKFRFSLLYNNYVLSTEYNPGKSVLLLQQSDFDHLWLLAEFIMWHQLPRPDHWLRVLAENRQVQERPNSKLANLSLCEHLSSYGDCFRRTCRFRHVMWREEVQPPANYPTKGDFRFHVLTCNSPTHIAVRLSEVYPTRINFLNTPMSQLGYEMHMYYEIEQNRRQNEKPKVGEIVIVKNMKRYERVVITGTDDKITVRLLDTGIEVLTYKPSQVFICEERHQIEPGQAMEVRVIGIEPPSLDRIWTKDTRDVVRNCFFSRLPEKRKRIFSASVKFVLSQTIFVETVFDDKGRDLRSFILDRFHVHEELMSIEKLKDLADASQPSPKES